MVNNAKRNVTVTGSFSVNQNALITEQGFLEIEEKLNVSIIPCLRERINKALQRHALLQEIEGSGIKASDFIEAIKAHVAQIDDVLEFFEKANKAGSTENRIRAQILQYGHREMPGFNISRHTTAPLKQYKKLLVGLSKDLVVSRSLDGKPRDICFNMLLRDLIEIHDLLKSAINRKRLDRLIFVKSIFAKMTVYKPIESITYMQDSSLKVTMQRLAKKLRDQN